MFGAAGHFVHPFQSAQGFFLPVGDFALNFPGAAPAQFVRTEITGLRTSGVSWMGMVCNATSPNKTVIRTAAITAMGRWMEVWIRFMSVAP
jgi:hypothetical protein